MDHATLKATSSSMKAKNSFHNVSERILQRSYTEIVPGGHNGALLL